VGIVTYIANRFPDAPFSAIRNGQDQNNNDTNSNNK